MTSFINPADETIRDILTTPRSIAIVGCSPDPSRDSHKIAALLKAKGHTIIPVNPHCREVLGERCFPSLRQIPDTVDIVDVFRTSDEVISKAKQTINKKAKTLWLQLDIISPKSKLIVESEGINFIENKCTKIEHEKFLR